MAFSTERELTGTRAAEVLVVEDDAGDALLVEELLKEGGPNLTAVWAPTVTEAVGLLSGRTVCILLDLGLPDSEGLDGLRRILGLAGQVPVIVLTGKVDRDVGQAAVAEGAQDYLVKGRVSAEELVRSIRYAVERRKGQETSRRLAEAELMAAEKARLERGLLPRPVLFDRQVTWATRYRPGGDRALLGGDFFDGIELEDGTIRVVMGDVTGHGPDEAALGVALRVAWRSLIVAGTPSESVLRAMQAVLDLERHADDIFATVCDMTIRPDRTSAQLRVGGHPPPLLLSPSAIRQLAPGARGPLLGLLPDATWPETQVQLGSEWALMLFTDGIVEGRSPGGGRLDVTGLIDLAASAVTRGCSLGGLADELITGAEIAHGGPLPDDVALFLLATGPRW